MYTHTYHIIGPRRVLRPDAGQLEGVAELQAAIAAEMYP